MARVVSASISGCRKPISACPDRSRSTSPAVGFWIRTTSSASRSTHAASSTLAPASTYASSSKPAAVPAPASTTSSTPNRPSRPTVSGTIATRRSPGADSFTTPTTIAAPEDSVAGRATPVLAGLGAAEQPRGVRCLPRRNVTYETRTSPSMLGGRQMSRQGRRMWGTHRRTACSKRGRAPSEKPRSLDPCG